MGIQIEAAKRARLTDYGSRLYFAAGY